MKHDLSKNSSVTHFVGPEAIIQAKQLKENHKSFVWEKKSEVLFGWRSFPLEKGLYFHCTTTFEIN